MKKVWWLGVMIVAGATAAAARDTAGAQLHQLFDREWAERLEHDPLLATASGSRAGIDRLPRVSLAEEREHARRAGLWLEELESIDHQQLSPADQVHAAVFRWMMERRLAAFEHHEYRNGLTTDGGFHLSLARLPQEVPLRTPADLRAYFARLRAIPAYVDGHIELLQNAIDHGWTLPRVVLEGYDHGITSHVVDRVEDSVFFAPVAALPSDFPERDNLVAEGKVAVAQGAIAGYRRFLEFFRTRYLPAARESLGVTAVAGGHELYRERIRLYTTLDRSAKEIHELGLAEVARISAEMDEARRALGFEGDLRSLFASMRSDPRYTPASPTALLEHAAWLAKTMDGKLPELFGRLPRTPYTVEPVPDYLAPKYTAGRYVQPPADGSRAGIYWVNTHDLPSRPLYNLEALTLHEAVPGHHLQIALALEADAPAFRRDLYISAFGEGWGLYAERLGLEVGFYRDPASNLGRLTYEMWRACRLVIDTGIHAFGWSRDQAISYLRDHTALSEREVVSEVDRYISWPGQALAYKVGELEIRRLRREAEAKLGDSFDLRGFHDEILRHGSVPLPILAAAVDAWIVGRAGGATP